MKMYDIQMAHGSDVFVVTVREVVNVEFANGIYLMYDIDGKLIFSSPADTVLYINES